jgi:hypothetical protein
MKEGSAKTRRKATLDGVIDRLEPAKERHGGRE